MKTIFVKKKLKKKLLGIHTQFVQNSLWIIGNREQQRSNCRDKKS